MGFLAPPNSAVEAEIQIFLQSWKPAGQPVKGKPDARDLSSPCYCIVRIGSKLELNHPAVKELLFDKHWSAKNLWQHHLLGHHLQAYYTELETFGAGWYNKYRCKRKNAFLKREGEMNAQNSNGNGSALASASQNGSPTRSPVRTPGDGSHLGGHNSNRNHGLLYHHSPAVHAGCTTPACRSGAAFPTHAGESPTERLQRNLAGLLQQPDVPVEAKIATTAWMLNQQQLVDTHQSTLDASLVTQKNLGSSYSQLLAVPAVAGFGAPATSWLGNGTFLGAPPSARSVSRRRSTIHDLAPVATPGDLPPLRPASASHSRRKRSRDHDEGHDDNRKPPPRPVTSPVVSLAPVAPKLLFPAGPSSGSTLCTQFGSSSTPDAVVLSTLPNGGPTGNNNNNKCTRPNSKGAVLPTNNMGFGTSTSGATELGTASAGFTFGVGSSTATINWAAFGAAPAASAMGRVSTNQACTNTNAFATESASTGGGFGTGATSTATASTINSTNHASLTTTTTTTGLVNPAGAPNFGPSFQAQTPASRYSGPAFPNKFSYPAPTPTPVHTPMVANNIFNLATATAAAPAPSCNNFLAGLPASSSPSFNAPGFGFDTTMTDAGSYNAFSSAILTGRNNMNFGNPGSDDMEAENQP